MMVPVGSQLLVQITFEIARPGIKRAAYCWVGITLIDVKRPARLTGGTDVTTGLVSHEGTRQVRVGTLKGSQKGGVIRSRMTPVRALKCPREGLSLDREGGRERESAYLLCKNGISFCGFFFIWSQRRSCRREREREILLISWLELGRLREAGDGTGENGCWDSGNGYLLSPHLRPTGKSSWADVSLRLCCFVTSCSLLSFHFFLGSFIVRMINQREFLDWGWGTRRKFLAKSGWFFVNQPYFWDYIEVLRCLYLIFARVYDFLILWTCRNKRNKLESQACVMLLLLFDFSCLFYCLSILIFWCKFLIYMVLTAGSARGLWWGE